MSFSLETPKICAAREVQPTAAGSDCVGLCASGCNPGADAHADACAQSERFLLENTRRSGATRTDHGTRNGLPLAQNRLSYNLVITFPTPLNFSDAQALSYTREKIG